MTRAEVSHEVGASRTGAAAIALVERFLIACERRELDEASAMLAADAVIVFPGGVVHPDLHAMVADAAGAYRRVGKRRDRWHAAVEDDGRVVVTSIGRLEGEDLDGAAFDGVRYVDVFTVVDDRIVEQQVWNDLAAQGVVAPRTRH